MKAEEGRRPRTFEFASHCGTVLSGLNSLRNKQLLFDVTLNVAGHKYGAHRVVLASCSDYFRAMFTDAMKERLQQEVCLNGVSPLGVKLVIDYAYTSKIALDLGNIQAVLGAANHLQILPVVDACSRFLESQLDLDNCVDVATIAETYSLHGLLKHTYCFMAQRLEKLAFMLEFQRMTVVQLEHLLGQDYPVECTECEVLNAVLCWLHYDMPRRDSHTQRLLSHIHFADISHSDLEQIQSSSIYKAIVPQNPAIAVFIKDSRFVGIHKRRETQSSRLGLVNLRGLQPAIVNVGGFQASTGMTNSLSYCVRGTDKWRHLTTIPHVEQCNFGLAVLHNELYVIGGCVSQSLQENVHPFGFRFNPRNNAWTSIAPMIHERCSFYLGVVNEKLYAIGGIEDQVNMLNTTPCEVYNPACNTWQEIAAMPGCRKQHSGTAYSQDVYVCGGLDWDEVLDSLLCYDVNEDSWKTLAPMPTPRADHNMAAYAGKLYVAGGWFEDEMENRELVETIDVYDTVTLQWESLTRVQHPRYLASLVVLDDILHLIGGFVQGGFHRATKQIERFDLNNECWMESKECPVEIWEHMSCVLYIPTCREDAEVKYIDTQC